MMQVMSKEEAAKRGLFTRDPVTGKPVPFTTQRIEMTPEQRAQHYEDLAAGKIPF
jgi:N-acetylglutamate synthase/N-acetylornithine aminotransferase